MSKKAFVVILVLSVIVTYGATIIAVLWSGSVVTGKSGFPFIFNYSSLFGGSSINYPMFLADIAFWFFVLWATWKALQKVIGK